MAAAGAVVVFATGRPPMVAGREVQAAGTGVHYGVMANGSIVCTLPDATVLHTVRFPVELALGAVRTLRAHDPEIGFALATDAGFTAEAGFHERMPVHSGDAIVADVLEGHAAAVEALKLIAFHPHRGALDLMHSLPAVLGTGLTVGHMGADAVEIAPAGADKGIGLSWLCRHLNIRADEVMVFGDEVNDLPMFEVARRRVAVANANPLVRNAADEVTASNADDGVAVVLERLLRDR